MTEDTQKTSVSAFVFIRIIKNIKPFWLFFRPSISCRLTIHDISVHYFDRLLLMLMIMTIIQETKNSEILFFKRSENAEFWRLFILVKTTGTSCISKCYKICQITVCQSDLKIVVNLCNIIVIFSLFNDSLKCRKFKIKC